MEKILDSFAVYYLRERYYEVLIPEGFVRKWWATITNPLNLISLTGKEGTVSVNIRGGKMIMGEGWEAFANEHGGLQQNVILFEYLGSSVFNVTFIDEGRIAMQVVEPRYNVIPVTFWVPFLAPHTPTSLELPPKFVSIYQWEMRSPLTIYNSNGTPFKVSYNLRLHNHWLEDGWPELVRESKIERPSFLFFTFTGNNEMHLKVVHGRGEGFEHTRRIFNLLEDPHAVPEEYTWTTKIPRTMSKKDQALYVPVDIAKRLFVVGQKCIQIMLPNGNVEEWKLLWSSNRKNRGGTKTQCHVGVGWYTFGRTVAKSGKNKVTISSKSNEEFVRIVVPET